MRHRRKGRTLGRSPSHQRALLRNLASALFLTERDADDDDNDNDNDNQNDNDAGDHHGAAKRSADARTIRGDREGGGDLEHEGTSAIADQGVGPRV